MSLSVNAAKYARDCAVDPSVAIGEYFVDREKEIFPGRERARHLHQLPGNGRTFFDLNKGYENFQPREGHQGLGSLLSWAQKQSPDGEKTLKEIFHDTDFVARRGVLVQMGSTPYAMDKPWRIAARLEGGIIWLEDLTPDLAMSQEEKLGSFYGYKFQQYMTTEQPGGEPNTDAPIDQRNPEQQITIIKRGNYGLSSGERLGVVCFGEVDAIDKDGSFVDLKTQNLHQWADSDSQGCTNQGSRDLTRLGRSFWRYKALKVWLQAYLVGAKSIVVGLKEDGIVNEVVRVRTEDVRYAAGNDWDYRVCFNFTSAVLGAIKNRLSANRRTLRIDYDPRWDRRVQFFETTNAEADFLPPAFIAHFKPKEKGEQLTIEPPIAKLPATGGVSTHRLVNAGATRLVFQLRMTNSNKYVYKLGYGFVEPGSSGSLEVTRRSGQLKEDKLFIVFGEAAAEAADAKEAFKAITPMNTLVLPFKAE